MTGTRRAAADAAGAPVIAVTLIPALAALGACRWRPQRASRVLSLLLVLTAAVASGCAERQVAPRTAPPPPATAEAGAAAPEDTGESRADRPTTSRRSRTQTRGLASFYGAAFEGKETASGRVFDKEALVAAHPSYPFGTRLRVTNLANGKTVDVRVIDRGPRDELVVEGVIIDLSQRAAQLLDFVSEGRTRVRLVVLEWGRDGT